MQEKFTFMPFHWTFEDEKNDDYKQVVIRSYGWNEKNESVYCFITDFDIPIWLELPEDKEWTESKIVELMMSINNRYYSKGCNPTYIKNVNKEKLYYASLDKTKDGKYTNKKYPFIELGFRNMDAIKFFTGNLKKGIYVSGFGNVQLKPHTHEGSITPVLKLLALGNLPSSSWICCKGIKIQDEDKTSTKTHEYKLSWKDMVKMDDKDVMNMPLVYPKILSFDNEAYSSTGLFPKATLSKDKVIMIGATTLVQKGKEKTYEKHVLTLGNPNDVEGVFIHKFRCENELYLGFSKFIREFDPDIIIGYNIFGWDIPYMYERAGPKLLNIKSRFEDISCIPGKQAVLKEINWESSAYGKQDLKYYEVEGRLFIDLLPYIKRNYKWSNYRLETACEEILKDSNKDPLKPKELFKYWENQKPDELAVILKYCAQDTLVTLQIFEKALIWFDLVESATTNGVPIFYLYTKGQQIKMYALVLKYCYHHNIVVQSNAYEVKDGENYTGAFVEEPMPGLYNMILPFDFASLYPSIIQAHNIDYSKLVLDDKIPDEMCNVFDWVDHKNCPHDPDIIAANQRAKDREQRKIENLRKKKKTEEEIKDILQTEKDNKKPPKEKNIICGHFRYRFLKEDITGRGVIPTLLTNLLKARKDTRAIIAQNKDKIKELIKKGLIDEADNLKDINIVLDKRQNAYKVSANSMYGAMGVKKGYLPLLPGAMCVTSKGRESIKKASKYLQDEHQATVIYNDTDSCYTYFPCLQDKSHKEIWAYAENIVNTMVKEKVFPPPMKLEFEDKAYVKFMILTKKRYCAYMMDSDGKVSDKMLIRGIALTRRDNCKFLRTVYDQSIRYILNNSDSITKLNKEMTSKEILNNSGVKGLIDLINDNINSLFQRKYNYKDFVITQALTKLEYKTKSLPAHAIVYEKMKARGINVLVGTRIEYVIYDKFEGYVKDLKKSEHVEDMNYFAEYRETLRIDFMHYLKSQSIVPLDELLNVCCYLEGIMDQMFDYRVAHNKLIYSIKNLQKPKLTYID